MALISPSMLSADYVNLQRDIEMTEAAGAKWLHIDIMDGHFVPNISFGYSMVKALRPITDMVLDVHLMIDTPIRYVDEFCKAGADYLTIHVESDTPENIDATLDRIIANGVKPGIVVKPKTPAEAVLPYLHKCELVLVMTVEPGFGGQKFMADMMPKLKALKEMIDTHKPGCHLEVDGGVDMVTAEICKENGADVLVAGSAFYKAEDKVAFVKSLES
ncbi:MAG: ribulose-phosphate 3-epimerase [Oscillospiraceae bacterium]|nr:ribulose-phosphate 3-epimerase [Oscillospiraceae bacterium]